MMATGLVPRRGQETGGDILCFLSWFSSLSEFNSSPTTPGQTKQVQMELQQTLACRELVDQIRMLILSGIHLIMNLLQIKRITILIETFTMSYAYQIMNQR